MDKLEKIDHITEVIGRYTKSQQSVANAGEGLYSDINIYSDMLLEMAHIARSILIFSQYGDKFTENMLFKMQALRTEIDNANISEETKHEMKEDVNLLIRFIQ